MSILRSLLTKPGVDPYAKLRREPKKVTNVTLTRRSACIQATKEGKREPEVRAIYSEEELEEILTEPLPNLYEVFKAYNAALFDNKVHGFLVRWCPQLARKTGKTQFRHFGRTRSSPCRKGS